MQQTINIKCLSTLNKIKTEKIKHNKQCRDNDVSAETLIFNLDQPNKSYITRNKNKIHKKKHDKRAFIQKTKHEKDWTSLKLGQFLRGLSECI